jgi:hypothetical protein
MKTAEFINFTIMGDKDGSLVALEKGVEVPFSIKRVYYIFHTKREARRGLHAHKNLKQVVVCISGSCKFLLDNGKDKDIILLNSPDKGLIIMYDFSDDCILMVLTDNYYDEDDYIRDYNEFLDMTNK